VGEPERLPVRSGHLSDGQLSGAVQGWVAPARLRPSLSPTAPDRPAPLAAILSITFLGSVSGGAFWAGLFFVTAEHYKFSPLRNLVLAGVMGAVYTLAGLGPVLFAGSEAVLWICAILGSAASAVTWPVVESYLAAGRHGRQMRAAIGWFNVTWTPATAVPLLVMPLFARVGLNWSLGLSTLTSAGALLVALFVLPVRPGAHEPEAATAAVGTEYPALARSSSWLLPLSYVIASTLAPVLPHRLAAVGVAWSSPSVVAALWMGARFLTLLLMWRTGFWHGRWGTLASGCAALAAGMALVLMAGRPAPLIAGLLLFGAGMGLTYYAALYYTMAVGHAAVEASGNFEALIGIGYCVGPVVGMLGQGLGAASAGTATVTLTWIVAALASRGALLPYLRARRARRRV
jgi:hypothetical protein